MGVEVFGVLGFILTAAGVLVSVVQTVRYANSQRSLQQLKRTRNSSIWLTISMVLNAYETLEDARNLWLSDPQSEPHRDAKIYAKLSSARRSIVNQYLQLLREAILDEDDFSEETIQEWRRVGRLENDWRMHQARRFLTHRQPSNTGGES